MTSSATTLLMDEYAHYLDSHNDHLKDALCQIEGVPHTTYVVQNGRVFVFDKLVQLVAKHQKIQPEKPLADLAHSLIAEATVSAQEAVEIWGVVPAPYELIHLSKPQGWMIWHRPFRAALSQYYPTQTEAHSALARVLLGHSQSGPDASVRLCDAVYRGQPLTLSDPLDIALLPPRPTVWRQGAPGDAGYTVLGMVAYEPGFTPISEALFQEVKALEASWANESLSVSRYTRAQMTRVWAHAATLRWDTLNDPSDAVPDYGQQEGAELRTFYPELARLSDGSLYGWFDLYQNECCYLDVWTANRDDDFLFYLLGKMSHRQNKEETAKTVGQWVAYTLLQGDTIDAALDLSRAATLYDSALSGLAHRIAEAMRFLAEDKNTTESCGHAVTTLSGLFRMGRGMMAAKS